MNLNYIDGLLWHLSYDADRRKLEEFWPVLKSHLAWEKRNFDPDGVSTAYLKKERERAYRSETTPDCRSHCSACGASCLLKGGKCDA